MPAAMPRRRPEMERMLERVYRMTLVKYKGGKESGRPYASIMLDRFGDERVEEEREFLWCGRHD